jgi:hypothetical protein
MYYKRRVVWHQSRDDSKWYWTADLYNGKKRIGITGNYYDVDRYRNHPPLFCRKEKAERPNTGWSATPLARLLAKIRATITARLNPGS